MGIWTIFFKFRNKNVQKHGNLTPMRVSRNDSLIDVKYSGEL